VPVGNGDVPAQPPIGQISAPPPTILIGNLPTINLPTINLSAELNFFDRD
jgi:hypothetical protein